MKIKTYLPVFPGFYGTLFEGDIESFSDGENDYIKEDYFFDAEKNKDFYIGDFIKNREYEARVGKLACDFIEKELSEYTEKIEFESIDSPKEYNFSNDSINCTVTPKIEAIKSFIYENKEKYEQFLIDNFKSRSGFMSFFAYDFESWKEYTKDFTDYSEKGVYLGSILQFICEQLEIEDINMYDYVSENTSLFEFAGDYGDFQLTEDITLDQAINEVKTCIHENYANLSKIDLTEIFEIYNKSGLMVNELLNSELAEITKNNLKLAL